MVMYCTCATCVGGPAQPNNLIQGDAEHVMGAQVILAPGQFLAHYSGAAFAQMRSREIMHFYQWENRLRVGLSFFLYNGPPPLGNPPPLALMGLGGPNRYTIDQAQSAGMTIFCKNALPGGFPREVAVYVGCGGHVGFAGGAANAYVPAALINTPILTR